MSEREEAVRLIVAGKPSNDKRIVSHKEMEEGECIVGGKHHPFLTIVGFGYPQFCTNKGCNVVSNEYPPDIDWENI